MFTNRNERIFEYSFVLEKTYVTTKNFCHVMLALIKSESVPITSNHPSKIVETTFLG